MLSGALKVYQTSHAPPLAKGRLAKRVGGSIPVAAVSLVHRVAYLHWQFNQSVAASLSTWLAADCNHMSITAKPHEHAVHQHATALLQTALLLTALLLTALLQTAWLQTALLQTALLLTAPAADRPVASILFRPFQQPGLD